MTKKVLLLLATALVIVTLSGCSSCRSMTGGWFNRGDRCCPPPACPPGVPQATMMLPGSPQMLPGPIEIAPQM